MRLATLQQILDTRNGEATGSASSDPVGTSHESEAWVLYFMHLLLLHRGKSPWAMIPLQVEVGELSQDDFKAQNLRVSAMDG